MPSSASPASPVPSRLSASPDLAPALAPLAFLLGRWAGEGHGEYPTVAAFGYGEEITVSHVGKPFLSYTQRSWDLDDGRPLHTEMGYWRCPSAHRVELLVAHPTGHVELSEGQVDGTSLVLSSAAVLASGSAKDVRTLVRRIDVRGHELGYELDMAAMGIPLTRHLRGVLRRVAGP